MDRLTTAESGIGRYCHPADPHGKPGPRRWIIMFEDSQKADALYFDESAAFDAFARVEAGGWNAHLFVSAERAGDVTTAPIAREPIGFISGPSGTMPYKHFVRTREPRDDEVGMLLYAEAREA
jgi:hypothetical protein